MNIYSLWIANLIAVKQWDVVAQVARLGLMANVGGEELFRHFSETAPSDLKELKGKDLHFEPEVF